MKFRKIILVVLAGLVMTYLLIQIGAKIEKQDLETRQEPITMVVATDLHYLSQKLTDNGKFFTDMIENADGKNMVYIEEITDAFIDKMLDIQPEILVLSGDLTFNGEKESHIALEKKLRKLRKKGIQVFVTTGNHDINRSSAAQFKGDSYVLVDSVTKNEFANIYQEYGLQQSLHRDDKSLSYIYQARKDLWLLFLDTNSNGDNYLSADSLNWVTQMLEEAKSKDIKVLSITHQNVMVHNKKFTEGFLIDNFSQLQKLYQKYDVIINLSGHIHIQHILSQDFTEIVTSSLAVSPHQYGLIAFDGEKLDYQSKKLDISSWAKAEQLIDHNLLNFTNLSRDFMVDLAKRKFSDYLPNKEMSEEDRELSMNTLAQINADYFSGNSVDTTVHEKGIGLLQDYYGGFTSSYLETILLEIGRDNHHLSLSITD